MMKKSTLLRFGIKILLIHSLENSMQMAYVITQGSTVNQNIIKLHDQEVVKKVKKTSDSLVAKR